MPSPPDRRAAPDRRPARPRRAAPWLRALLDRRDAARPELRRLPLPTTLSLIWWSIGLTPTARLRARTFRENIRDGRGLTIALTHARRVATI